MVALLRLFAGVESKVSDIHQKLLSVTKNISVLYAEDNNEIREQYENIFKLLFKEVNSAQNGEVALKEYNKKRYDLLITDLTMPKMDGVCLISEVLKINPDQNTIIMTAHNTDHGLRNSIDFQVDGILLKPVAMDKLFKLLYKVCNLIDISKRDSKNTQEDKKLDYLLQNNDQALFLVVVDMFKEIKNQFGSQTQEHIFSAVKEHLSYFGIEDNNTVQLHNDVIICATDKHYIDNILDALQSFSDNHNTLIVTFNNLKIYITLSYGLIMLKNNSSMENRSKNFLQHIYSIVDEIKNDEHSTYFVKMDIDIEEAKKSDSLSWLGVTLDALKQKTIVPFYQPVIDMYTMKVFSYEVFSRIKQGDKYILPKFFIDLSEKAGILEDISEIVFKQCFKELSSSNLPFHINMSNSLFNNNDIEDYLIYLGNHFKVSNNRVILDIRNYESLKPSSKAVKAILRLKNNGYKIALKGFATSNINIELLSILEPDYIKIDQLIMHKSLTDTNMKAVLSFLLEYTNKSSIKSILVGVEDEKILDEGKKLGFDYAQGYFIGRPSDKL
ncbi:EAL domain-containing protein [Candidatus Sulfurimonas marisnigri]|uniref:EAL domain-containing protein n=1 Tax=Candidatus Sulfurimonas marisnigri TaxID=2740405 RepID=A0A7S7M1F5_9BACT|nr:EAL domain-containing protein [Candidatus Sulfurimonas marisnigri]QOY55297.1 EAL domain-containing protein [Candidatus Sulfurimonas marisnigri]